MKTVVTAVILVTTSLLDAQAPGPAGAPATASMQSQSRTTTPQGQAASNQPNPFTGSVPSNELPAATIALTIQDAIQRGLKQNLGLVVGDQNTRLARAEQLRRRATLRPELSARIGDTVQQINLAAFGFSFHFPGINIPSIVGPFNVFDARAYFSQNLLDFQALNNSRASRELTRAAEFNNRDSRDIVVLLVAAGYLQVVNDEARIDEARTEVNTAQTLFQRAQDQLKAGLSPALDALRAQVELQSEQTRLRSFENDYAKDKLALARLIGLPLEQRFTLADKVPYSEITAPDMNSAMSQALQTRADYKAAEARVKAAELTKQASIAERYPTVALNADYGDIGLRPWNSHGTFSAGVGVRMAILDGGRIQADIEQSDAELHQRQAELADLKGRIEYDVRTALLDLQTARDQLQVARSSVDLSRQALTQAQDRFTAGVADNIEVVQAQNAVAAASTTYIDSLYAHNVAKVALARAIGIAGQAVQQYLGGK